MERLLSFFRSEFDRLAKKNYLKNIGQVVPNRFIRRQRLMEVKPIPFLQLEPSEFHVRLRVIERQNLVDQILLLNCTRIRRLSGNFRFILQLKNLFNPMRNSNLDPSDKNRSHRPFSRFGGGEGGGEAGIWRKMGPSKDSFRLGHSNA